MYYDAIIQQGGNAMENQIEIRNVDKFYGKTQVLYDINLTIGEGIFGLLGRNGAGKTSLMKLLAALQPKQGGSITVCGIPISRTKEIHSLIGYLPQDFSMYPTMTAEESLDYLGVLSGMSKARRRENIQMLLARVNLTEQRHKRIKALSGGMKRRLGIAQALLHNPRVLIIDEPTAGLDPEERIRLRNLLCEIAENRIVLLSTHIVGDIEAACEQIAVMNEGRILFQGAVSELIQNANGKVFTAEVSRTLLPQLKKEHILTGMLVQDERAAVRLISETAPALHGISSVKPNLEDAYMYCLSSSGCSIPGGDA